MRVWKIPHRDALESSAKVLDLLDILDQEVNLVFLNFGVSKKKYLSVSAHLQRHAQKSQQRTTRGEIEEREEEI